MGPSEDEGSTAGPPVFPYGSAAAFRTALRDRFAAIAKADTRYSLDELQRQFAYDRALARFFTAPDAGTATETFPSQLRSRSWTRPCGGAATHNRRQMPPGRRQHSMRPSPW